MGHTGTVIVDLLTKRETDVLEHWLRHQLGALANRSVDERELRAQAREFLARLRDTLQQGAPDALDHPAWADVKEVLDDVSRARAQRGFTPSETAVFVFSLKQALFAQLRTAVADPDAMADGVWAITQLIDQLGLYTTEVYQKGREDVIARQQRELLELSTPVVQLWDGVLAVPLIGALDSNRTQIVMESLLQRIVDTGAALAIIDITGVPTVDTLVAQHLLKTVAAARLMGADCIISGIRPQIAQTIVHLGVELGGVVTKATLAAAFGVALQRLGYVLVRPPGAAPATAPAVGA